VEGAESEEEGEEDERQVEGFQMDELESHEVEREGDGGR